EALAAALAEVEVRPPRVPVWSNVDARPHTDPQEIRQLLVRQVLRPVLWEQTLRGLLAAGVGRLYEIGPGRGAGRARRRAAGQGGVCDRTRLNAACGLASSEAPVLLLIYLLVFVALAALLWAGTAWFQGYIYNEPAEDLYWRAPAAAGAVTLFLAFWGFLA